MKIKNILLATLLIIIICACQKTNYKGPELILANEIHLESIRIHENIETEITEKKQKAIINKDLVRVQKLDSLSAILELWEDGVVEVPGFGHEHQQGEHHEHKLAVQMTDESMLEYQKNSKQAIEELQQEIKNKF
ncbi:hypothetical protein Dfri01_03550 [Dyadobacter frigoris]|uniref:hypothetical protein n=1 Tax=Dyadobacter frigoris TaxID=2576211 RepID=UPI00249FCDCF|nr:hypothetical protein [Dyadobacter frigoris]GLU50894.1 hypothetical protein Dfri01_03550 [Dyadobacter frigoris]